MATRPYLIQTGMGADLHGGDDTKAACRAVRDAIGHNSMLFLRHAGVQRAEQLRVEVVIACPHPDRVDVAVVKAELPVGTVMVEVRAGGLFVETATSGDPLLLANAAITVSVVD